MPEQDRQSLSDEVRSRTPSEPPPSVPTPLYQFSEALGLSTPAEIKARPGQMEKARADLHAAREKIAEQEELTASGIEKEAQDISHLSAERTRIAAEKRPIPPTLTPPPEAALLPGSTDDPSQLKRHGSAPAGAEADKVEEIVRRVLAELKQ